MKNKVEQAWAGLEFGPNPAPLETTDRDFKTILAPFNLVPFQKNIPFSVKTTEINGLDRFTSENISSLVLFLQMEQEPKC